MVYSPRGHEFSSTRSISMLAWTYRVQITMSTQSRDHSFCGLGLVLAGGGNSGWQKYSAPTSSEWMNYVRSTIRFRRSDAVEVRQWVNILKLNPIVYDEFILFCVLVDKGAWNHNKSRHSHTMLMQMERIGETRLRYQCKMSIQS